MASGTEVNFADLSVGCEFMVYGKQYTKLPNLDFAAQGWAAFYNCVYCENPDFEHRPPRMVLAYITEETKVMPIDH